MCQQPAIILYIEKNRMLLETVRDVLEFAGWYVRPCSDFGLAVAMVEVKEQHFDLLLLDNELRRSDFTGLDLVRRARRLPHRKQTPIVLLSLKDCAEEARRAGADAFLRKPNNLLDLVETIRRLLDARSIE